MENVNEILKTRHFEISKGKNPNPRYEMAKEFLEYIGIDSSTGNIIFVLKLIKQYGAHNVYSLRSWFKDMNFDTTRWKGLIVWKLKNNIKIEK